VSPVVASLLPMRGLYATIGEQAGAAIRLALGDRAELRVVDDSSGEYGSWDVEHSRANCKAIAADRDVVAVIGPFNSGAAIEGLPLLRGAGLAVVSPSNTYAPLTVEAPAYAGDGPERYAVGGAYARVVPNDLIQGAALALLARERDLGRIAIWHDGEPYGRAVACGLERAAPLLGLELAASTTWEEPPAEAEALVLAGASDRGDPDLAALVAGLGGRTILASDAFWDGSPGGPFAAVVPGVEPGHLPPRGERFADELADRLGIDRGEIDRYAVPAAQACEVVLDAISRSDGTRAGVADAVLATRVEDGLLGTFAFDERGEPVSDGAAVTGFTVYETSGDRFERRGTVVPPGHLADAVRV
jgi:branched-chain amino acid transport system substrate-binding protein